MLYEQWLRTLDSHADRLALYDRAGGRTWSFSDLHRETLSAPSGASRIVYPSGRDAGFVLEVLRGWRAGRVVCPLESGQQAPVSTKDVDRFAHLKLTSSTTGPARMIGLSGDQMAADAGQIVATMGLHEDSPNLGVISLAHSYGFSNLVLPLLLHGIPLILLPSAFPAAVFQEASQWSDVSLPAVPALWQAWANGGKLPSSIRLAISAGAPLPVELERLLFERDGIKVHNFLGASECGGIAYDRTAEPRSDWAVAGTAMEGVQLHIADDGCLEVQSPSVADTYYPDSDDRLGGGIYRSGDLAEIAPSGQIRLLGRSTDLINVAGRKVGPETIEVQIREHPAVADVLIFSVPEAGGRNEAIVAAVALTHPVSEMELRDFLARSLPSWQLPRRWWFLDEIPADVRGKRSRKLWRDRFLDARGSQHRSETRRKLPD